MKFEALKVGDLAKRTGLTVRTLRHYDEIGLLKPSLHTEAGYRLYTRADVARLQQVLSLRQLGFALEEIRECLDRPGFSALDVIRLHIARLRQQIELQQKLLERLEALAEHFHKAEEVSADEVLYTIEVMTMFEKYYTPEQMESFRKRHEADPEGTAKLARQGEAAWAEWSADVKAAMDTGVPAEDPKAQELAKRWLALVTMVTGGDPGIYNSLRTMYQKEDNVMGMDTQPIRQQMEYILKAADSAGIKHPGQ
jgi:DNA-binding transcriptional MerR regulator